MKCIAFDLDDTLLDTSGLLVPEASYQACKAMKDMGFKGSIEECMRSREKLAKEMSHREIFLEITRRFNKEDVQRIAGAGIERFYNPHIPDKLPLLPGAESNLIALAKKYTLFLVTSGAPNTQKKKIEATGIKKFFSRIYTLDGFKGEKKRMAFEDILRQEKIQASDLISIGNRLYEEIRQAKQLGAMTCYFKYGEHVGEVAQVPEDDPDFTVLSHDELISTCYL